MLYQFTLLRVVIIMSLMLVAALSARSQQLCIQANTTTNLQTLLQSNLTSCGGGSTLQIMNGGTTGVTPATGVSTVNPTSGGTITVQVVNSSGNNCGNPISINVINTAFTSAAGTGCFGVALTAAGGNGGCSYAYLIDGNWVPANASGVLNYNFNSGGSFPVRLRVTCGTCTFQSATTNVSVAGAIPALTFQGDTYLETVPVTNWESLPNPTVQSNNTNVVAYCVYVDPGVTNFQFPLRLSDASSSVSGVTNYQVVFQGSTIYNSASAPTNLTVTPVPSVQGYYELHYTLTLSGGCQSTEIYRIYIAENLPLLMTLTPSGGFNCIGNNVTFSPPINFGNFPSGTEIKMIVACNATLTNPVDTVYAQTWSDPSLVPNPISWSPSSGSCGCTNGNYYVFAYASNPCYPSNTPGVAPFAVNDATATFPHDNIYCQGAQTFTWPTTGNCNATHVWQLTNPSGVTTNLGNPSSTSANVNFNAAGNWTLNHQVNTTNCGNDAYLAQMCVSDNVAGSVNWGSYTNNSSVCLSGNNIVLNPVYTLSAGLFFCPNQNITYNWSVSTSSCSPCDNNTPCYQITGNGTPNPTITLSCACNYTITCNVTGCGNDTENMQLTLVAPPQFNIPPACLTACLGQPWSPDGCITPDACNGGSITSSGYTYNSTNYVWSNSVTFPTATTVPVTLTASTTVGGSACSSTQNISVVVSPPPSPQISGPTSVCAGTSFSLTNNTCSGTGQWSVVSGGNLPGAPTNAQISTTTEYQFTCTVGGCSGSDTHLVDVTTAPTVSIVPPAANPCAGGNATFSANITPTGTYTYQWSLNGTNTSTNPTYTLNPNNGDVIGLSVGYGGSCLTTPVTYTVTQATVNVTLNCSTIPQPLCTDMSAFALPAITYPTGVTQDSITLNGVVFTGNTINPATLTPGQQTLEYHYSDANSCSFVSSCSFDVAAPTSVVISTATATLCEGSQQTFTYTPAGGSNIVWSSTPCSTCIDANGVFTPTNTNSYTISVDGNCIAPAQTTINVVPNPTGTITSPLNVCATQTLPLTGTANPAGSTVAWTIDGTATTSPLNPIALGLGVGAHNLCMNITDSNNCTAQVCQNITVANATMPLPTLTCNPVLDYFCYDMGCVNTPAPNVPSGWTLQNTTWNSNAYNQTQICAGQGIYTDGAHTLSYSLTDGIGCPMTLDCQINIHDTLDVTITYPGSLTICESQTIDFGLNVSPGPYGTWQCPQCPSCIDANGLFTPNDVSVSTNYTIIFDGDCVSYTSVVVTVNPNPSVTANAVTSLCINETTTLQGTLSNDVNNSYWQWNGTNLSSNILDPDAIGMTAGSTYQICYHGSNNYNCSDSDCFNLLIEGLPGQIVLDDNGEHCLASPFTIPVNNVVNYTVEFTDTSTNVTIGPYNEGQTFSFPDNGTYHYVITIASTSGCTITQEGDLTVLDNPVADIAVSNYNVCAPQFSLINNSTGDDVTYTWTGDLPFSNPNNALPSPSSFTTPVTPADASYQFILTVTNNCASSTDDVTVYFQAAPVAYIDTLWTGNNNCAPFCIQLNATSPSTGNLDNVIYSWPGYTDLNSGSGSVSFPNLATHPQVCFDSPVTATIDIQVYMENQCGNSSATIPVMVLPSQVEAEFSIPNFVCPGNSIPITDNSFPATGATVTYSISPANQGVYVENGQVVTLLTASSGNYILTQNVSGCGTDSEQHSFTVGTLPNIQLAAINGVHCTGESVQFTATQTQPTELQWDFGDGSVSVGYSNIEHTYYEAGTYTVNVTGTSSSGCPGSASGIVNISGDDDYILLSDSIVCGNSRVKARTSNVAWIDIVWTLTPAATDPVVGMDEFEYYFTNNTNSPITYTLQMDLTNINGCVSRDIRTIVVKPGADVTIELEDDRPCDIPFRNAVVITNYRGLGWNYEFFIPDAVDQVNRGYKVEATFYSSQTVVVTARNSFGCTATSSLAIECIEWPYYVPNAFTPDDDGLNDAFKPVFSNVPFEYEFSIYNRWGEVVFYSTDSDEYWIGDYDKHKTHFVPDGVYNWLLKYKSNANAEKREDRGHVTIIR